MVDPSGNDSRSALPRPLPPPGWRDRVEALLDAARRLPVGLVTALALAAGGVVALVGFSGALGGAPSGPPPELSMPHAGRGDADVAGPTTTSTPERVRVHAAGAVLRPGVVDVGPGARVADVVEAAGGPAADADLDQVNLAAPVADGERVYVPRRGEVPVQAIAAGTGDKRPGGPAAPIDLNRASATELESLPGVGPATAQAIVDHRSRRGRFKSVDDLLEVRGIGPAKLSQIRPHAKV